MRIFTACFFVIFGLVSLFTFGAAADELDVLYSFYNGLADIVEQNRNNPDECVAKVEEFVKNNVASMNEAAKKAKEQAEQRVVTEEEAERMMNQPPPTVSGGQGMNAIERFSLVFGIFAQKYPEHASKITKIVQEQAEQQPQQE